MPKSKPRKKPEKSKSVRAGGFISRIKRWFWRGVLVMVSLTALAVFLFSFINPPITPYMAKETSRLGDLDHEWVDIDDVAPVMVRSVVAAEDADYCLHWGLDVNAIRSAMEDGAVRGGSTISQQVVKNVYLWQDRSWIRKMIEAGLTPVVEAAWTKRRILEVYLNVAEFDEGVFGVQAAAQHYFGVDAIDLSAVQSARLAAILPAPKSRSASQPTDYIRSRANQIVDGAATIARDGRSNCFELQTAQSG